MEVRTKNETRKRGGRTDRQKRERETARKKTRKM